MMWKSAAKVRILFYTTKKNKKNLMGEWGGLSVECGALRVEG
jgi:hypothetical protein